MSPKLSIIIPCYNCEKTLEEAVVSCFTQNLENFEIIMVDDASMDNTREIIKKLSEKHQEIKVIYHDKNKGGGAARNTAVKNSSHELIFCLDSDDILPEGTLEKMLKYWEEKRCDGVAIHRSIKFKGLNINDIERIDEFGYANQIIPIESLIEKPESPLCPLYSVFMFTKKAWEKCGGYPENHGFDTQGFAWRFLLNGLKAYTCPNTSYLHRVNFHNSYYLREYMAGKINMNWQLVLREFISAFSKKTQIIILDNKINDYQDILINKLKKIDKPWSKKINDPSGLEEIKKESLLINQKYPISKTEIIARNSPRGIIKRIFNKITKRLKI